MTQMTVREARESRKPPMTQERLADKSGVDQTYISLIERLLRNPSDDIKRRLAKALGIAPSRLRFSDPEPIRRVKATRDRTGQAVDVAAVGR
jgi:transcriptional regulator with XRE-family HTH domain